MMLPWRTRGFLDANPRSRRNKNKQNYFGHKSDIKGQCTHSTRLIITVYYIIVYFKYCMLYIYCMLFGLHTFIIIHLQRGRERERECVCLCVMIVNVSTCRDVRPIFNYKGLGAVYGWSANPEDCASWAFQEVLLSRSHGVQVASPCNLRWQLNIALLFFW